MKARAWKAFLPITTSLKGDEPPDADGLWLASRGINVEALSVLRCMRQRLLPVLYFFGKKPTFDSFHFLIHGHAEGVPCKEDDSRAFIDLTLYFKRAVDAKRTFPQRWCWVAPRKDEQITEDIRMLNAQSSMYRCMLVLTAEMSDLDALKYVRQRLHYFANMSQMVVQ